ncbi:hypothetical protein [Paraburkholderia sp.]|uniref:hypothetical protein n=1 Tax=Paraburkholderia sp. TaxID=1926495 RepID=UPI00286F9F47|nr:hypothetical protein [Paraburkholderia sp.]
MDAMEWDEKPSRNDTAEPICNAHETLMRVARPCVGSTPTTPGTLNARDRHFAYKCTDMTRG